jgi:hypothetical protein
MLTPAFSELQRRAGARQPVPMPRRWVATSAWAAGLAAALVMGWQLKSQLATPPAAPVLAASASSLPASEAPLAPTATQQEVPIVPVHVAVSQPKPRPTGRQLQLVRATRPVGNDAPDASDFASAIETDSITYLEATPPRQLALASPSLSFDEFVPQPVSADPGLEGLWRTITPDGATPDDGDEIAMVPGLPVIQMRQQPAVGPKDSPMTAVDQLLESGDMIRTISGPASRVTPLVDEDAQADSTRITVAIRQGGLMVAVTGPKMALGSLLEQVKMRQTRRRY